jgi:hypothetical protein
VAPLDAERDLRKDWLRYREFVRFGCRQSFDDRRAALHECRDGVGIEKVGHKPCGSFERRACFTTASNSSTAALVSSSTCRSWSRNSGAHPRRSLMLCSSARDDETIPADAELGASAGPGVERSAHRSIL